MASTYSTNLAIELIGTGDQAGTWGVTTNTNLGTLIEQAISGYVTQAVATGTDTTITIPNGATGVARNMFIEMTGTGGAATNLIVPANKKLYFIYNNSTGAVTVKVSGQTGVSVPQGKKMILVSNGTDVVAADNYIADFGSNSATITQLTSTSGTITTLASTSASITNLTAGSLVLSNLSIASANVTTLTSSSATISTTLALSGGTANGVLYLNGSKVATSGSALTFDGSGLGINMVASEGGVTPALFAKQNSNGAFEGLVVRSSAAGGEILAISYDGSVFNHTASYVGSGGYVPLAWTVSGSEQMRLNSTGLGIGTSSPADKLHVTGTIRFGANASYYGTIAHDAGVTGANIYNSIDNGGHLFQNNTSTVLTLNGSGNLGLGVTPSAWGSSWQPSLQVGTATLAYLNNSTNRAGFVSNAYNDNSNWKYMGTGASTTYIQYDGVHYFNSASSGIAGNNVTFTQVLSVGKDVSLALQGADSQSGAGITFPATQSASSNANTLDDYEEGTWTPSLGGTATYTTQSGTYTKIGRQVTVSCKLQVNAIGTGTTTTFTGLPFTSANADYFGTAYWHTSATALVYLAGGINPSSTTVTLYGATAATGTLASQVVFQNGAIFVFTATYFV